MKIILPALIFLVLFVSCNDGSKNYEDIDDIVVEGRSTISWDDSSRVKIAPADGESGTSFSYPRLEELDDGTLLAIYEDCSGGQILLKRSDDGGLSWGDGLALFSRRDNVNPAVPEIILLDDGTLLAAANYRPAAPYSTDRRFGISVKRSTDNGYSWSDENVLYEGGYSFENGCWEPVFFSFPRARCISFLPTKPPISIRMIRISPCSAPTITVRPGQVALRLSVTAGKAGTVCPCPSIWRISIRLSWLLKISM